MRFRPRKEGRKHYSPCALGPFDFDQDDTNLHQDVSRRLRDYLEQKVLGAEEVAR